MSKHRSVRPPPDWLKAWYAFLAFMLITVLITSLLK